MNLLPARMRFSCTVRKSEQSSVFMTEYSFFIVLNLLVFRYFKKVAHRFALMPLSKEVMGSISGSVSFLIL